MCVNGTIAMYICQSNKKWQWTTLLYDDLPLLKIKLQERFEMACGDMKIQA